MGFNTHLAPRRPGRREVALRAWHLIDRCAGFDHQFAARPRSPKGTKGVCLKRRGFAGQLHSSLNGGSLEQGGIDGLMAPAPPLDGDTPLDAAPLLDVDTRRDP